MGSSSFLASRSRRWWIAAVIALVLCLPTLASVSVKSGASGSLATVDATSLAMRATPYDARGNVIAQKATYSGGIIPTATAAGTGPFFSICGSGTKTIRVQRFNVNGSVATAATRSGVILRKTSTATSAGTPSTLTAAPHDSTSAAATATLVNYYTALATAGSSVGNVGSMTHTFPITATIAATDYIPEMLWDFEGGRGETEGIVLRGATQCLEAAFAATTTNAPTLALEVTWTEE